MIYANDGLWTSRLRREWGLFFDRHEARASGLTNEQKHERKEKDRGDHRHHAIDAVAIALCTPHIQSAWDKREKEADADGINTADQQAMENYRRQHELPLPSPFKTRDELRSAVEKAIFGSGDIERPVSHRPVKRKLIGSLHEETLFGPVVDCNNHLTNNYTGKKSVYALTPNHLRVPEGWDELSSQLDDLVTTDGQKKAIRKQLARLEDPAPGKPGLVRDRALRDRIRKCMLAAGLDLGRYDASKNSVTGGFTANQLKKAIDDSQLKHASGVPIHSVILLRTMSDAVVVGRRRPNYLSTQRTPDSNPRSKRAYVGGNNHHMEIRVATTKKGSEKWSGQVVSAFEAAQRKLAKLQACRDAGIPNGKALRELSKNERDEFKESLSRIEKEHPIIDRSDDKIKGGRFVMSLAEGETLLMKHKKTKEEGYFVVAKINKRTSGSNVEVVPHWDVRAATGRKNAEGKKVTDSTREQFSVTPTDLKKLAPHGCSHAVKVHVSPLGKVTVLKHN